MFTPLYTVTEKVFYTSPWCDKMSVLHLSVVLPASVVPPASAATPSYRQFQEKIHC